MLFYHTGQELSINDDFQLNKEEPGNLDLCMIDHDHVPLIFIEEMKIYTK